jgi:hypothetical protein
MASVSSKDNLKIPVARSGLAGGHIFTPEEIEENAASWQTMILTCTQCSGSIVFRPATKKVQAHFKHDPGNTTHRIENCPFYSAVPANAKLWSASISDKSLNKVWGMKFARFCSTEWMGAAVQSLCEDYYPGSGYVDPIKREKISGRTRRQAFQMLIGTGALARALLNHSAERRGFGSGYQKRLNAIVETVARNTAMKDQSGLLWLLAAKRLESRYAVQILSDGPAACAVGATGTVGTSTKIREPAPRWLSAIVGGKNDDLNKEIASLRADGSLEAKLAAIASEMFWLLERFPYLVALKSIILKVRGSLYDQYVSQIYLMSKSDNPNAFKVGKSDNPDRRAGDLSAGQMHAVTVVDSTICLDWRAAEKQIRNKLRKSLGATQHGEWLSFADADVVEVAKRFQAEAKASIMVELALIAPPLAHS